MQLGKRPDEGSTPFARSSAHVVLTGRYPGLVYLGRVTVTDVGLAPAANGDPVTAASAPVLALMP